jgi:hypothetical protein
MNTNATMVLQSKFKQLKMKIEAKVNHKVEEERSKK